MSDDQTRQRLETSKQRARVWREWGYFALTALVGLVLVMSMLTFRATQQMVGATNAEIKTTVVEIRGIAADIRGQVALLDVNRVNKRVDDLGENLAELNRLTVSVRGQTERITKESVARLRDLREPTLELKRSASNLADFIAATDTSVNRDLLPPIAVLATKLGTTADETNAAIKMAADKAGVSLDEMNRRLADPRIDKLLDQLVATGQNVQETSAEIREAAKKAPTIAASLDKIARETSKWARISLIANVVSTLARAFIP